MSARVWRRPAITENEAKSAMFVRVLRKMLFWKRRITRAVIGMGTNEWPSPLPEGYISEASATELGTQNGRGKAPTPGQCLIII